MDNHFNHYFQQQIWNSTVNSKNLLQQQQNVSSTDKNTASSTASSSSNSSATQPVPSATATSNSTKMASQQPPHSTNRDLTTLSLDNRLYLDGLRQHQQQQQQRQNLSVFGNTPSLTNSTGNRDSNNNSSLHLLSAPSLNYSNQKLASRLDETIRTNQRTLGSCSNSTNSSSSTNDHRNILHHQHGTILFNTLNGGAMGSNSSCNSHLLASGSNGSTAECFSMDMADSTTPPPSNNGSTSTILPPPPPSSASSTSSTISTNLVLNLNSNGSNSNESEKVKTPNSIRGKLIYLV